MSHANQIPKIEEWSKTTSEVKPNRVVGVAAQ